MSAITERDLYEALKALNASKDGWSSPPRYILDYGRNSIGWGYAILDQGDPRTVEGSRIVSPRGEMDLIHVWIWAFVRGIDVGMDAVHQDQFEADKLEA